MDKLTSCLMKNLRQYPSVLLAFSGGVDSSFLLYALRESGIPFTAVMGISETVPPHDVNDARALCQHLQVPLETVATRELSRPEFVENPPDRCFHCKDDLFTLLGQIARQRGIAQIVDGSNADDLSDHRPGRRAAALHNVASPLAECGFTKSDIRTASRAADLPTAAKPSSPCLSSRFAYGTPITTDALSRVARSEQYLRSLGFSDVRVRIDNPSTARIEVPVEEVPQLMQHRPEIVTHLRSAGFAIVTLDLEGLVSGKMNRALDPSQNEALHE